MWTDGEIPEAIKRAFTNCEEQQDEYQVYDANGLGAAVKVYLDMVANKPWLTPVPYFDAGKIRDPEEWFQAPDLATNHPGILNKDRFRNTRSKDYYDIACRFEATYNAVEKGIYTDPGEMISLNSEIPNLDILKSELIKIKRDRKNNNLGS